MQKWQPGALLTACGASRASLSDESRATRSTIRHADTVVVTGVQMGGV